MIELPEAINIAGQINDTIYGKHISSVISVHTPHKLAWYYGDKAKYSGLLIGRTIGQASALGGLVEISTGGTGTDANAMQLTREGIPTALLSIPLRNMHTPIETLSVKDLVRIGRLMAYFIASLDDRFMDKLAWPSAAGDRGGN